MGIFVYGDYIGTIFPYLLLTTSKLVCSAVMQGASEGFQRLPCRL